MDVAGSFRRFLYVKNRKIQSLSSLYIPFLFAISVLCCITIVAAPSLRATTEALPIQLYMSYVLYIILFSMLALLKACVCTSDSIYSRECLLCSKDWLFSTSLIDKTLRSVLALGYNTWPLF